MFSVAETTLSILRTVCETVGDNQLRLYAIIPYAYEYVRRLAQVGMPGLTKAFTKQIIASANARLLANGLKGIIRTDPSALMRAYLSYEISRVKSSVGRQANLDALLLHETITDMALGLNLDWFFKSYMDFMLQLGIQPGFNTRNFVYLVNEFKEWNIDLHETIIVAPFNRVGFQMNPSRTECEDTLKNNSQLKVIAISILAAGYLDLPEAIDYIASLPNLKGVAVGVSKERHASQTFELISAKLG